MPELKSNWRRGFWSLIATQFQGAFNENALKFLTIYLILALVKDNAQRDRLEFLVGVLFAAPFIFFSLSGGYLADRFSKRSVTLWTKVFEIGVMLLAVLSLAEPNFPLALAAIFSGLHARRAFRAVEIWPASRTLAGGKTFLGQRGPRTGDVSGDHRGQRVRRGDGRPL